MVALAGTFLLCLGTLASTTVWRSGGVPSTDVVPVFSSADLALSAAALPTALTISGTARAHLGASTMDGGIAAVVVAERRDGFQEGMIQDLRSGARALRALAWVYGGPGGAADAYARSAGALSSPIPDPSLHSHMEAVGGLGSAALFATYDSVGAGQRYTVSTIVLRMGRLVVQVQAFPAGATNGDPTRDRAEIAAVARRLLARATADGD